MLGSSEVWLGDAVPWGRISGSSMMERSLSWGHRKLILQRRKPSSREVSRLPERRGRECRLGVCRGLRVKFREDFPEVGVFELYGESRGRGRLQSPALAPEVKGERAARS